jgi:probable phosphoglycerate mutase
VLHPILVDKKSPPAGCTIDIQITDGFLDVNYGAWRWKTYDEAKVFDPFLFSAWFETPHLVRFRNGDSLQDLVVRSADALRPALSSYADETVVLVSQTSVIGLFCFSF